MNDPNYTLAQAQESSTDLWLNIPLYNALAEQGNMDAQHRLAQNYIWLHKYTEALHWGLKAAEQGQIDAMLLIATIYGYNFKKYKNLKEQIKWLKKAVALKSIDAHIALAHTYLLALDEYSEYTDINKGISLLKCVVEQVDHPEALHLLSIFDKQNAKKWLILGSQKEQIRSIISLIELL